MTEVSARNRVFEATGKGSFLDVAQHVLDDPQIDIGVVRNAASPEECQTMQNVRDPRMVENSDRDRLWYQTFPNQVDVNAYLQQWWMHKGLGNVALNPFTTDGITGPGIGVPAHLDNDALSSDVILRYGALDYSLNLIGQATFCGEKLTLPTDDTDAYVAELHAQAVSMSRMPPYRLRSGVVVRPGDLVVHSDLPNACMHGVVASDNIRQACLGGHLISRIDPEVPFSLPDVAVD